MSRDDGGDAVTACLGSVRPPKQVRNPTHGDGRQLCKFFMKQRDSCYAGDQCPHAHIPRNDRPVCWSWKAFGVRVATS